MRADKIRLLQFVESMTAAAAAFADLHNDVGAAVERKFPGLGTFLTQVSDGLAQGVCDALEERGRAIQRGERG